MIATTELNEIEVEEVRNIAEEFRGRYGIGDNVPIANDLFSLLDRLSIVLIEYPVESDGSMGFDAYITRMEMDGTCLLFLGLNSAQPFDKQLFDIAHELYHYLTDTIEIKLDEKKEKSEKKADRFAAELLLPHKILRYNILKEFQTLSLEDIRQQTILRFIARIHCQWRLPYKSIVKRLLEENFITKVQYSSLYSIDERDEKSSYGCICNAIDENMFRTLNSPTNKIGTTANYIEVVIRNYEDGLIDLDSFTKGMTLLGKHPEDFFPEDLRVSSDDIDEFNAYLSEVSSDESQ